MQNPIILFDNVYTLGTPTATDTEIGYSVLNISDLKTYTWWQANSNGTKYLAIDCSTAQTVNCLAVIGHNFFTSSATVSVESSVNGSDWTERLAGFTVTTDKAFMKLISEVSARYWRIKIVTASIAPKVAVLFLGDRIDFAYPPDCPYFPYQIKAENTAQISKRGNVLGVLNDLASISITPKFSNIDRSWFTTYLEDWYFNHARYGKPFFYAWDLTTFPTHVYYVWLADNYVFKPSLSVSAYVDDITINLEGYYEDD
jgi:hypothetical protein